MNIIEAFDSPQVFRQLFKKPETWNSWRVFLKGLFNLPLLRHELSLFNAATGLFEPYSNKIREAWLLIGRRSGKSYISAILSVHLSIFKDWSKYLSPGEKAYIFIISVTKFQAETIKGYISGILNSNSSLKKMIKKETALEIELMNNIVISCQACSYRGIRGKTVLVAILEEICFWRWEVESANQDIEVVRALSPALGAIPESLLIAISSPYVAQGIMAEKMKKYHGQPGPVYCWKSDTQTMNPTYSKAIIQQAYADDPESARAEFGGEWRTDLSTFIDPEIIKAAIVKGRFELEKAEDIDYQAFIDPSGGREDSFTLAIAHKGKESVVLDVVREVIPPFRPESVVEEYSKLLKSYGILKAQSDRYAGEWVTSSFRDQEIDILPATKSKSEFYFEFLPLLNNRKIELLDNKRLSAQLGNLQRRTRSGGKDLIDNFYGHDDLSNVVAAGCVMASQEEESKGAAGIPDTSIEEIWGSGDDDEPNSYEDFCNQRERSRK